jgi:endonuclease/exonuclease/phosphatase family metal-dependent hydrolase
MPRQGALLTRLERPALSIVNTHLISNADGDWSPSGRFHPLHAGQLAALARAVAVTPAPAVACGDFNIPAESALIADFLAATGLADAFGGRCPPTFRAEFLPPGAAAHAVDLILVSAGVKVAGTGLLLAGKSRLPGGPAFASDHVGLRAALALPA